MARIERWPTSRPARKRIAGHHEPTSAVVVQNCDKHYVEACPTAYPKGSCHGRNPWAASSTRVDRGCPGAAAVWGEEHRISHHEWTGAVVAQRQDRCCGCAGLLHQQHAFSVQHVGRPQRLPLQQSLSCSLSFVILTCFLTPVCLLAGWGSGKASVKEYCIAFLVLESLSVTAFSVLDLLLFYIFFEIVLISMFLILGVWGTRERKIRAAHQFLPLHFGRVTLLFARPNQVLNQQCLCKVQALPNSPESNPLTNLRYL